jgi:hypothetical protein
LTATRAYFERLASDTVLQQKVGRSIGTPSRCPLAAERFSSRLGDARVVRLATADEISVTALARTGAVLSASAASGGLGAVQYRVPLA